MRFNLWSVLALVAFVVACILAIFKASIREWEMAVSAGLAFLTAAAL